MITIHTAPCASAHTPTRRSMLQAIEDLHRAARFEVPEDLEILATIRYDPHLTRKIPQGIVDVQKSSFFLLPEHIERLKFTLNFFRSCPGSPYANEPQEIVVEEDQIFHKLVSSLEESGVSLQNPLKVRLLIGINGDARVELYQTAERRNLLEGLEDVYPEADRYSVYLDKTPVLASPYTSFKTTNRAVYNECRARCLPGLSDREEVILVNTTEEVMEGSITNIAIKNEAGDWITPKLTSGCLCGVTRHFLLKKNLIKEGTILRDMLKENEDVLLMNGIMGTVRGTIKKL